MLERIESSGVRTIIVETAVSVDLLLFALTLITKRPQRSDDAPNSGMASMFANEPKPDITASGRAAVLGLTR